MCHVICWQHILYTLWLWQSVFSVYIVTLSADADPAPGGYVVPEGGNVTFTCTSSDGYLLWSLNVTGSTGYSRIISNTEGLKGRPRFSVSDESTANTSIFTLHNISVESNPSPVECYHLNIKDVSKDRAVLMIIVEGEFSTPTSCCASLNGCII